MRYTTAAQVEKAVRSLWAKNGCVVLSQVRNGTGFEKRARTADMVVISTWPSRGLYIDGVEIKVSRDDLRKELATPEKADAIARYCDHWWLAVPDDLLADDMILPEKWGVVTVDVGGKAKIATPAKTMKPVPMDALLVCSIIRNFQENFIPRDEFNAMIEKAKADERVRLSNNREFRATEIERAVYTFQKHTGIDIMDSRNHCRWDLENVGAAVNLIVALQQKPMEELRRAAAALAASSAAISEAVKILSLKEKIGEHEDSAG